MSRIHLKSLSFAKGKAKELKELTGNRSLSACHQAYAFMLGYSDWRELSRVTSTRPRPSQLDDDINSIEQDRRESYQVQRLVTLWRIPVDEARALVQKIRPTALAVVSRKHDLIGTEDGQTLSREGLPDKRESTIDLIIAAVRGKNIQAERERLLADSERMQTRTEGERLRKAIFVGAAEKKLNVMENGGGSEDYAQRLEEAIHRFFTGCHDITNPHEAVIKFRDDTFDLFSTGRKLDARISDDAMDILKKAFQNVLGIELKQERPEETVIRRLTSGPRLRGWGMPTSKE